MIFRRSSIFLWNFDSWPVTKFLLLCEQTREELRDCLENEMRAFLVDKELGHAVANMAWNHTEFEVG